MIKWSNDFTVNVKAIDEQHMKLVEIMSRIQDALDVGADFDKYDQIMDILFELKEYTVYHFNFEEELMEKYGYDQLESQKFEHIFFVKKLGKILNRDIDNQQEEMIKDVATFLLEWIMGHILKSDMNYKEFFNAKGVF